MRLCGGCPDMVRFYLEEWSGAKCTRVFGEEYGGLETGLSCSLLDLDVWQEYTICQRNTILLVVGCRQARLTMDLQCQQYLDGREVDRFAFSSSFATMNKVMMISFPSIW